MKTFIIFKIYAVVFLTVVFIGCSTINNTSVSDELNTKISPTPNLQENPPDTDGRIVKKEGWQIPPLKKMRNLGEEVVDMDSEDGESVKVTLTFYAPKDGYRYTEKPSVNNPNTGVGIDLSMLGFTEFKVKERVFLYSILAITRRFETEKRDNSTNERYFSYQIGDRDGDGKFESLLIDKSKFLVPAWAVEYTGFF
jgi:hypothetical protein